MNDPREDPDCGIVELHGDRKFQAEAGEHKGVSGPVFTYIRFKDGEDRRTAQDRFAEGLVADHPVVGEQCPSCYKDFQPGEKVTLFAIGPDSLEQARKADAGRWYNAVATIMHQACAWPEENEQ